jgi:hypothetical protein
MRVALGPKDWAEVKPVEELTRADRRAVNAVIVFETEPAEQEPGKPAKPGRPIMRASMDDDMFAAVAARVVTDWSLPLPKPSEDPSALDRLSLELDSALHKAVQPHLDAILGKAAPVEGNEVPTPASASLSASSRGFPMTRIRSRGRSWLTRLTRTGSAGRHSRSTSSPSSKTSGLSPSSRPWTPSGLTTSARGRRPPSGRPRRRSRGGIRRHHRNR